VLRAALGEAEAQHLRENAARLAAHGLEWLEPAAAREREPRLSEAQHGALWSPREGHVYSPLTTRAYAHAAARLGAALQLGCPVEGLVTAGERVTGVRAPSGEWSAGHVVLCGGVWTRFCAEWVGAALSLEPVRGQILALETPEPPLRSIVWSEDVYLVPKLDGTLIVGATEEHAGFDCRTTAEGVARLLAGAARIMPELARCTFRHAWAGLRPDTPDHLPLIGPLPGVEGLLVAAGHYRNGVLLSPITGEIVRDLVLGRELSAYARPFGLERLRLS
jgi:glycine oxidase